MPLQGIGTPRAISDATELDARLTRRDASHVAEWGSWTFYRSDAHLCLVRAGAGGVEEAWKYHHVSALALDWNEITTIAVKLGGFDAVRTMRGDH